jgi:hypothetical protein
MILTRKKPTGRPIRGGRRPTANHNHKTRGKDDRQPRCPAWFA